MRKSLSIVLASVIGASLIFTGCTLNESQTKQIAYQAGIFTTLGWFAIDNPPLVVKDQVKDIIVLVSSNAVKVGTERTYSEVLLPIVETYIVSNIQPNIRPLVYAGSMSILGGMDIMFAGQPEWKKNTDLSISIVNSFGQGALHALSLSENSPENIAASRLATRRGEFIAEIQRSMIRNQQNTVRGGSSTTNAPSKKMKK